MRVDRVLKCHQTLEDWQGDVLRLRWGNLLSQVSYNNVAAYFRLARNAYIALREVDKKRN